MFFSLYPFCLGYVFNSVEEIMPYLEDAETGPTVNWARKQGIA